MFDDSTDYFNEIDINHDKVITFDEFAKAAARRDLAASVPLTRRARVTDDGRRITPRGGSHESSPRNRPVADQCEGDNGKFVTQDPGQHATLTKIKGQALKGRPTQDDFPEDFSDPAGKWSNSIEPDDGTPQNTIRERLEVRRYPSPPPREPFLLPLTP